MTEKKEVRCPTGPRALLAKVLPGEKKYVDNGQLLELACRDCAKLYRKNDPEVARVLHRYNILGELINTMVERRES